MEEIFQILHECHASNEKCKEASKVGETDSLKNVKRDTEELLANARCNMGSVEYANLNKMLAICYLKVPSMSQHLSLSKLFADNFGRFARRWARNWKLYVG